MGNEIPLTTIDEINKEIEATKPGGSWFTYLFGADINRYNQLIKLKEERIKWLNDNISDLRKKIEELDDQMMYDHYTGNYEEDQEDYEKQYEYKVLMEKYEQELERNTN